VAILVSSAAAIRLSLQPLPAQDFHALRTNVTQAFGVSADGSVVVVAIILERPYRWTATTGIVYLGARSHGDSTAALRVNAEGSVIKASTLVALDAASARYHPRYEQIEHDAGGEGDQNNLFHLSSHPGEPTLSFCIRTSNEK
jgi:hypothetical protein